MSWIKGKQYQLPVVDKKYVRDLFETFVRLQRGVTIETPEQVKATSGNTVSNSSQHSRAQAMDKVPSTNIATPCLNINESKLCDIVSPVY